MTYLTGPERGVKKEIKEGVKGILRLCKLTQKPKIRV